MDVTLHPADLGISEAKDIVSSPFADHTQGWDLHYLAQVLRSAGVPVKAISLQSDELTIHFEVEQKADVIDLAVKVLVQRDSGLPLAKAVAAYRVQLNPDILNEQLRALWGPEVTVYVDGEYVTLVSERALAPEELQKLSTVFMTWEQVKL